MESFEKIKKIFYIIIVFFTLINKVLAQEESHSIYFNNELSIDSINALLIEKSFPFKLCSKFINSKKVEKELVINYGINKKNEIYKTYSELNGIIKIINKEEKFYLMLFYDQVGYDFFLIVQETPFMVFKSEHYNYEQDEGYRFIIESLDFENKTIKIFLNESKIEKTINFNDLIIR